MSQEELIENLDTIAHSGSKEFMEALKGDGERMSLDRQIRVGFYSVFMVAEKFRSSRVRGKRTVRGSAGKATVEETTASRKPRATAWYKNRHPAEGGFSEFIKEDRIKDIIQKYSAFVQFPVSLNGEKVNTVDAIWIGSKRNLGRGIREFYKFQANEYESCAHAL